MLEAYKNIRRQVLWKEIDVNLAGSISSRPALEGFYLKGGAAQQMFDVFGQAANQSVLAAQHREVLALELQEAEDGPCRRPVLPRSPEAPRAPRQVSPRPHGGDELHFKPPGVPLEPGR